MGHAVVLSVKAMRYKPEGRRFDSQRCPPGRIMALRSTQCLIKKSTRNIFWVVQEAGKIFLKSGRFELLDTAGPIQACTEVASPLTKYRAGTPITCANGNREIFVGTSFKITEVRLLFRGK